MSLSSLVTALPSDETWGPPTTTDALVDGVPYAPYSKGDKLGRMADWASEGKDGRDGRGGRQQYNRNYRGGLVILSLEPQNSVLTSHFRSASLRRWHVKSFRYTGCRR